MCGAKLGQAGMETGDWSLGQQGVWRGGGEEKNGAGGYGGSSRQHTAAGVWFAQTTKLVNVGSWPGSGVIDKNLPVCLAALAPAHRATPLETLAYGSLDPTLPSLAREKLGAPQIAHILLTFCCPSSRAANCT